LDTPSSLDHHLAEPGLGARMDIGAWLRGLGLGQYGATFRENKIDAEVLLELTDTDLGKIGVPLGYRKCLLKAIARPDGTETATKAATPAATASSTDAAELRQLTVMFRDLIGSTALSARLDPEDMRRVIRANQDASSGVVARYDVAKFMGDGILAYFGFPRAHKDDPERAVRAGPASFCRIGRWDQRNNLI
jgi:class 3 adenylate cyclase